MVQDPPLPGRQSEARGDGGRPEPGRLPWASAPHPEAPPTPPRPPPPEARQRPASPADNDRGRPAWGLGHNCSLRSAPLPCQRRRSGGDSRPRPRRPALLAPHHGGPFSLHHRRGSRGRRWRSDLLTGRPRGMRIPSGLGAAASAGGAAGSPAASLGRSCQNARPGWASPGRTALPGRASRRNGVPSPAVGGAVPAAPHLRVGPTQAVSVLSISCKIRSCSGRLSAILDGRDPAAAPLQEVPGRDRGRRRPWSRRGGLPGMETCRWPGRECEGEEREAQVGGGRVRPVPTSSRPLSGEGLRRRRPGSPTKLPRPLGCPCLAPPALPCSAPCERRGTPGICLIHTHTPPGYATDRAASLPAPRCTALQRRLEGCRVKPGLFLWASSGLLLGVFVVCGLIYYLFVLPCFCLLPLRDTPRWRRARTDP